MDANFQVVAASQSQFLLLGSYLVVPGNVDHHFIVQLLDWSVVSGSSGNGVFADALQRSDAAYFEVTSELCDIYFRSLTQNYY